MPETLPTGLDSHCGKVTAKRQACSPYNQGSAIALAMDKAGAKKGRQNDDAGRNNTHTSAKISKIEFASQWKREGMALPMSVIRWSNHIDWTGVDPMS